MKKTTLTFLTKARNILKEALNLTILGADCYYRPDLKNISSLSSKVTDLGFNFLVKNAKPSQVVPSIYIELNEMFCSNSKKTKPEENHNLSYDEYIYNDDVYKDIILFKSKTDKSLYFADDLNLYYDCAIELLFKIYGNNIYLDRICKVYSDVIVFSKDILYDNYFDERFDLIYESLKKYNEAGIPRSLLFYGVPGSGKSTIMKSLSTKFGFRTIRIPAEQFVEFDSLFLEKLIKVGNVGILIVDDIDRTTISAKTLEIIDTIKESLKFIFFSANNKKLNDAFMRMGRIDQIIEIKEISKNTIIELLGGDELYETVKDMPIAYILELKKRMLVLGKEEGLREFLSEHERIEGFLIKK
jgi:hypothetical protein